MNKTPILLGSLLLAAACTSKPGWQTSTFLFFDTVCQMRIECPASRLEEAQAAVEAVFSEIEKSFSPQAQDLSSPHVLELFDKALQVYKDSQGAFDISVAPLSHAWGFHDHAYRLPSPEEIRSLLPIIGMDKIRADGAQIRLPPEMGLDWGGIAKGYGIDLASRALIERGISGGFINAGGDLYCWGTNPAGRPWQVGIKHPRRDGFLGILSMSGLGAATTGDYQRFFEKDGTRYHHVFDPKTGYPSRGKQSVTVTGPETAVCDALATALFVTDEVEVLLKKYPDYAAVLVDESGKVTQAGKSMAVRLF